MTGWLLALSAMLLAKITNNVIFGTKHASYY